MTSLPVADQPTHRSAALVDQLARRMRLRGESALGPLGLRPRHLVAVTDAGVEQLYGLLQQATSDDVVDCAEAAAGS